MINNENTMYMYIDAKTHPLKAVNAALTPHFPCGTQGAGSKRLAEARINRLFSGGKGTFLLFPVIVFHGFYDTPKKQAVSRRKGNFLRISFGFC